MQTHFDTSAADKMGTYCGKGEIADYDFYKHVGKRGNGS